MLHWQVEDGSETRPQKSCLSSTLLNYNKQLPCKVLTRQTAKSAPSKEHCARSARTEALECQTPEWPFQTLNMQGGPSGQQRGQCGPSRVHGGLQPIWWRCWSSLPYGRMDCPAKDAVCHNCSKKDTSSLCAQAAEPLGTYLSSKMTLHGPIWAGRWHCFLDTVTTKGEGKTWIVSLYLNNYQREFKINTGADVIVIPKSAYEDSWDGPLSPIWYSVDPLDIPYGYKANLRGNSENVPQKYKKRLHWVRAP